MKSEIGSNFWEYELRAKEKNRSLWWESPDYCIDYFKSGRNAIKALCRMLNVSKKSALLPIYTCSTVIDPFLEEGWEIGFYRLNTDLTLNYESLLQEYENNAPSVILFHSFFGLDTLKNDLDIIRQLQDRGVLIVEDITQALLSYHHIPIADYYVSSLRKYLAIPDGGFIISKHGPLGVMKERCDPIIAKVAFEAFDLKEKYFEKEDSDIKTLFRKKYQDLNLLIGSNDKIQDISPESLKVFEAFNIELSGMRRRENYSHLLQCIKEIGYIQPTLSAEIGNDVPLYLPVYVAPSRKELQTYMAANRVYCPIIWPKPVQIKNRDDEIEYMYQNMLCFPIDQRYGVEEMNRVVELIKAFYFEV